MVWYTENMKIILIRHSHTVVEPEKYNPLWKLSEKGVEQASALAKHSHVQEIEVLYTSNQLKALHTGVLVAEEFGVFVKVRENLTELTSLTNDWKADYDGFIHDIYSGTILRHGDGESLAEATERFTKAVADIVTIEQDKEVVGIVAHGNILSLFASQYEDRTALEIHHVIRMPDIAVFDFEKKVFEVSFGKYESCT